ncbi:hypothetical protein [Dysgonomonas macrotermitis]|uniref:Uncharacterized protein n=1 Tax=Dysgonomonas macrotermitis TaxID=1346286 RepID=A0A1M5BFI3_9BACT|nr:hypothetical protein [Dysgonomonas macrotermitis]SHF41216.1 hypothetical protein SAMN05444362_10650 [Dysgonomonas macrotermitis]
MKISDSVLKYFLYISLVLIGVVVGIAIRHYYNLPIAEAINIVDLATLVVTVFLAVYIPEVLDQKLQVKRDKKDLIEKRVEELQALYRKINLIVQNEEKMVSRDFLIIRNTLDVLQHKLDTIVTLLTYSNLHVSFASDIAKIKELTEKHKRLLYSDRMEDEGFSYSETVEKEEELLYNKIDQTTSLLVFKLSDA